LCVWLIIVLDYTRVQDIINSSYKNTCILVPYLWTFALVDDNIHIYLIMYDIWFCIELNVYSICTYTFVIYHITRDSW